MCSAWSIAKGLVMKSILHLISAAHRHAATEADGDLDGILATPEGEPVYEFYPLGRRFRGMANTRRYYEHFSRQCDRELWGCLAQRGDWPGRCRSGIHRDSAF